jgi:hypothetical protein
LNALAPNDPGISIVAQKRNQVQSTYELDYTQTNGPAGSLRASWWTPSLFQLGMRHIASVTLDDDLLKTAHEYTGITERADLLREALKSIIAREAARRLLALAGTAPNIKDVRRRRVDEP